MELHADDALLPCACCGSLIGAEQRQEVWATLHREIQKGREAGRREGRAMAYESAAAMVSAIYDAAQCGEVVKALWNMARAEKAGKQEAGE